MKHAPGFLKLVEDTRPHVREVSIEDLAARLAAPPSALHLFGARTSTSGA